MKFNPQALYVTAAFVGLMNTALNGSTFAAAALLIAEGVVYVAVFGGYSETRP
jgi:hypothetical protein